MKFISIKDLTNKQLIQYGILGIAFGAVPNIFEVPIFIEVLAGALSFLGWICLVWGIIKWLRKTKKSS